MSRSVRVLALAGAVCGCLHSQQSPLGPLPENPLLRYEIRDVRAEVSLYFFVDPELIEPLLPNGIRVIRLEDFPPTDSDAQKYLSSHPDRGRYVGTVLSFTSVNAFLIDGRPASSKEPLSFAFWWAVAFNKPAVDPRARGSAYIELASWYPDRKLLERLRSAGLAPESGAVTVKRTKSAWAIRLRNDSGLEVDGACELTGSRTPAAYKPPQYATTWSRGATPQVFTFFTYAGHIEQPCTPRLAVRGNGALVKAMRKSFLAEGLQPQTLVTDGWFAQAGLYRH